METQAKILKFIKEYHTKHSLTPSIREICKGTGLKSTSSVSYHLAKLVENGTLVNDKNKSRAYRLAQDNSLTFKAKWNKLKKWLLEEKEQVEVLVDPYAEDYEILHSIDRAFRLVIEKIKELENGE